MKNATAARFQALGHRIGLADADSQSAFAIVLRHYGEGHRAYHNLTHIDRMLGWLDAVGKYHDAIELAIWFHDVIYEPLGADNEEKSAAMFRDCLGASLSAAPVAAVERLILATDLKRTRTGREDENLMIDLDLTILGSSPEDYATYRAAVRSEYAMVPADQFLAGRRAILEKFLSQPIYQTDAFQHLESQARWNMQHELERDAGS